MNDVGGQYWYQLPREVEYELEGVAIALNTSRSQALVMAISLLKHAASAKVVMIDDKTVKLKVSG